MAKMTDEALAQLKQKGIEFHDVDVSVFRDKIGSVYEKNAEKVGGMELIESVKSQ